MHQGFWQDLPLPIVGLSPMDGVTDQPFRAIQKKYGHPDVVYTEFTSVEGVCHGADRLLKDFLFDESQRPVVAQIYGTTPNYFRQTATVLCELGFDGIDINMGCPAKNVAHSGAGAALIQTPKLAQKIVRETKAGVQDWVDGKSSRNCRDITTEIAIEVDRRHQLLPQKYQQRNHIPVTVKTRIGYDQPIVTEWIPQLMETEPVVIAIHGRTLKQRYSGQANWEEIAKAEPILKNTPTLLLGNGDTKSRSHAIELSQKYRLDGVLIGRASFGNPYIFLDESTPQPASLFQVALEHAYLFRDTYQDDPRYNFLPMRKHLGWYIKEVPGAKEIRVKLFKTDSPEEVEEILTQAGLI